MKVRPTKASHRRRSRQASVLVCVLVSLAVAMGLVTSTVRRALETRRAVRTQHQVRQTELLLAAGIERARRQCQTTPVYSGETWELVPEAIPNIEFALVEIEITSAPESLQRQVRVTARLSVAPHQTIQRSHFFSINPERLP